MFDVDIIRRDFPILNQTIQGNPLIYLDNSATTQKPLEVIDSVVDFYSTMNANIHRGEHFLSDRASTIYESVRTCVQEFINAKKPQEIVFTSGTTDSLNLLAHCYGQSFIHRDDEIIITEMEHHSNIVPWQMLCRRKKASLKVLPVDDTGDLDLGVLDELMSERTKLISVTHLSNVLGTVNPVKEIIARAHRHNIAVVIDGAQAIARMPVDVQDLDCDFYVFSGHKLYAETGVGVLYAKEHLLHAMPPYRYGGGMISSVRFDKTTFADLPFKFEAGTSNISAVISLGKALEYVNRIGIETIQSHEMMLTSYAVEQLQKIDGVTVYANPVNRCGVVSFNIEGIHHYDAVLLLNSMGIALRSGSHCAEPLMQHYQVSGTLRASFAVYSSKADIDALVNGIKKVQEING